MSEETAREITEIRVAVTRNHEKIDALGQRLDAQTKRLDAQDELIGTVNRLVVSIENIAAGQVELKESVYAVRRDVDDIKHRPAKRWDAVVAALITGTVAYVIGRITQG